MVKAAEAIAEVGVQWGNLPRHRTPPRPPTTTGASQSTPAVVTEMAIQVERGVIAIRTGAVARPGKGQNWFPRQTPQCRRIHLLESSAQLLHKLSRTANVSGTVMIWIQILFSC